MEIYEKKKEKSYPNFCRNYKSKLQKLRQKEIRNAAAVRKESLPGSLSINSITLIYLIFSRFNVRIFMLRNIKYKNFMLRNTKSIRRYFPFDKETKVILFNFFFKKD